jgi:membrane-bound lytic murein transglycosylase D
MMKHCVRRRLSLLFFLVALTAAQARAQMQEDAHFPLLPGLEKPVEFWKRIFTEYSLSQLVFFDPEDMGRIYEVADVGEESRPKSYIDDQRARIAAAHGVDVERVKAQRGIRERTMAGLKRSGRYIGQMQQIFRERGLPVELTYLPLVESSFDSSARSYAGAIGIWQFMPRTGKEYLRVSRSIDERRDPLEATRAAASYLKRAHELLGNWPLAITSYNYGQAGMARAVAEVGSDNLADVVQKYVHPYFGFAPKNFYAEFLVAVDVGKKPEHYFPGLDLEPAVTLHEMELRQNSSLAAIIRSTGLTQNQLLGWNPALSARTRVIPAGYRVKVPVDIKTAPVIQVVADRRSEPEPASKAVRHRVKRGETLAQIARQYGASVERILRANGLSRPHLVKVGTTLLIPKL